MTNEEAIGRIRDHMDHHGIGHYPHLKIKEALDLAISALQSVGKDIAAPAKNDHSVDTNKMVPLTLEELIDLGVRAERGEKIIVYCTPLNDWCKVFKYGIMFFGTEDYRSWREIEETYGKDWEAYAYPPAHIDREAWTAEWKRKYKSGTSAGPGYVCSSCDMWNERPSWFCPSCGKAMTPEAWAELEKRLRG